MNISSGETISLPLSVTWHFGGKYSDVDLTDIVASGHLPHCKQINQESRRG
ncbi:MAG: hypothetical protein V8S72_03125 [Oscillospiraceae bacterium]